MPKPLRLRILEAITAALDEIDGEDGGYYHDLRPVADPLPGKPDNVQRRNFRGRVIFGDTDPLPMTSLLEVPLPPEQYPSAPSNPNRHGPWELMVQGFVEDDFENPTDPAQYLLADVIKRLALEKRNMLETDAMFGFDCITDLRFGVGVVRPPDEISSKAYFWLPITLEVVEDLSDPYDEP